MRLFISHKCFLCRWVEPFFRRWIEVYKIFPDGIARQVNGSGLLDGRGIPAVPALVVGKRVFVGVPRLATLLIRRPKDGRHD